MFQRLIGGLISVNYRSNGNDLNFMNQDTYQYYFESMPENSIFMEYIIFPLIIFLIILLIYQFIKKRIMKDDKNELESLKLLQELLEKGTINDDEFKKKKNKIISKW